MQVHASAGIYGTDVSYTHTVISSLPAIGVAMSVINMWCVISSSERSLKYSEDRLENHRNRYFECSRHFAERSQNSNAEYIAMEQHNERTRRIREENEKLFSQNLEPVIDDIRSELDDVQSEAQLNSLLHRLGEVGESQRRRLELLSEEGRGFKEHLAGISRESAIQGDLLNELNDQSDHLKLLENQHKKKVKKLYREKMVYSVTGLISNILTIAGIVALFAFGVFTGPLAIGLCAPCIALILVHSFDIYIVKKIQNLSNS